MIINKNKNKQKDTKQEYLDLLEEIDNYKCTECGCTALDIYMWAYGIEVKESIATWISGCNHCCFKTYYKAINISNLTMYGFEGLMSERNKELLECINIYKNKKKENVT